MPNVNMVDEMIALINTQRTYEANVTALNARVYEEGIGNFKG